MENLEILKQILCPPGDGVFTVETAKERKEVVQKSLYGQSDPKAKWESSLDNIPADQNVFLLGVPSDNGGGILRGANWGPLFLRERFIKEKLNNYFDLGDIRVVPHLLHDSYLNQETIEKVHTALYDHKGSLPVSPLSIAEKAVELLLKENPKAKPFGLGGDHSVSSGLLPAIIEHHENLGILHFDAHTDLLEERLGIDRCFATWAAQVLPSLKSPANMVQVGLRRSGKTKDFWENKFGLKQHWTHEVQEQGASAIAKKVIEQFKQQGIKKLYVSFDIDAIDSTYASATGTPEDDGMQPHEAIIILEEVGKHFEVIGADMVEVAPFINHHGSHSTMSPEPETTLDTATHISIKLLELMQ